MSIKVPEEVIYVFRSGSISIPFTDIEAEQGFIGMSFGLGNERLQVRVEKCDEILIKVFSEKMC
jgi:hypothetical protein